MKVSIEIGENKMVKYAEISDLNNNQIKLINKNGWCIFTECDGDGTYWHKGDALCKPHRIYHFIREH